MLTFNCSQAACDFFSRIHKGKKITPIEKVVALSAGDTELQADPEQWLVHAATVKRKHVLVVIHLKTRYSMLFFDMAKADDASFVQAFIHRWVDGVMDMALKCGVLDMIDPQACARLMSDAGQSYRLLQRGDRSSQTQINEILRVFKWNAEDFDFVTQPWSARRYDVGINRTPRTIAGIKGYGWPDQEMLIHWLTAVGGVDAATAQRAREQYRQASLSGAMP
ncbi:DUF6933 domain-containing protein [Pseudomonas lactucae]|uniref:DUF6933 domain-containing protein n=1 Tax=Pseudomonas lactucae TaxID=2813360 RepID=UPI0001E9726C|nr:hypothetical protein PFWH6_4552 [Pseudomonas fluorescens WH6]